MMMHRFKTKTQFKTTKIGFILVILINTSPLSGDNITTPMIKIGDIVFATTVFKKNL